MKLLLTGPPGVGKTTIIHTVISALRMPAGGFYTQEERRGGQRVGFAIKTLDGGEGILAHIDYGGRHRIGKYGVDLSRFEALALPALEQALQEKELIVIDEIGKMELFSRRFQAMVTRILDQDERHLLGVIHQGRDSFAESIRRREDVELTSVSRADRDGLPSRIIARLQGVRR
jgi:nucleoside-triphosphatase